MKVGMQKYTDMYITKTAAVELNATEPRKGKRKEI